MNLGYEIIYKVNGGGEAQTRNLDNLSRSEIHLSKNRLGILACGNRKKTSMI